MPDGDGRSTCPPGCGCSLANEFGEADARRDLRAYRSSGPRATTGWLIDSLAAGGVGGLTVLDIGAGVGVVHQELLARGAIAATDVDGSPAYVAVARAEAERRGTADRVRYEVGDFVAIAPTIPPADLVVLDRVICCYPDMRALVETSLARTTRRYGLVYPRDSWWIRGGAAVLNAMATVARRRVRAYVHRQRDVESMVAAAGFAPTRSRNSVFWRIAVFERVPVPAS